MRYRQALQLVPILICLFLDSATVSADEKKSKPDVDQKAIDTWVADLDHERLTKRQQASKKLLKSGKVAIPALAKSALSGKRETIQKSIDVLGKLAQSEDKETKEAATITLQMLSECDQPSTAERAKVALNTKEAEGIKPFDGWDKPNGEFAGGGGRNLSESVSVSNINGIRTINVKKNGLDTTISEQRGGGIRVRITGGAKPIELVAKNADDLKKQSPEAFAIYKRHSGNSGAPGNFNPFANGFGNAFNNGNVIQKAMANAGQQANVFNNAQAGSGDAKGLLVNQLQELKKRMANNPLMQQMLDQQIQSLKGK